MKQWTWAVLLATLPAAHAQISGAIRVLGNSHMATIMANWEEEFRKLHPDVRFENKYLGTANAIAGLYLETADLALMGREIIPMEAIAYRRAFRHDPLEIAVATASFDVPLETFAFALFVHGNNPLSKISFSQLRSVFGCDKPIRTWGELGIAGQQASRPIHLYGYETISGLGTFFASKILAGGHLWNCGLHEYSNQYDPSGKLLANAGDLMVKDLSNDPDGMAFCGYGHRTDAVKALAVSGGEGQLFINLSLKSVTDRSYPLTRTVYIYVRHDADHRVSPAVREFFRYVLGPDGRRAVSRQKIYLPLPVDFARRELSKLE